MENEQPKELTVEVIQQMIYHLPGRPPFMLAKDLATIYGTTTVQINQAVRRNPKRFPEDFAFKLTDDEIRTLMPQNEASKFIRSPHPPRGFTRSGANMLSTALTSDLAIDRSVMIMRAFSAIEEGLLQLREPGLPAKLAPLTEKVLHRIVIDVKQLVEDVSSIKSDMRITREFQIEMKREAEDPKSAVQVFFEACLVDKPGNLVEKYKVYAAYRKHALLSGDGVMAETAFFRRFIKAYPQCRSVWAELSGLRQPAIPNIGFQKGVSYVE